MNIFEKWVVRKITWMKPLDDLSLEELFKLQQDVGKAIAKKVEIKK